MQQQLTKTIYNKYFYCNFCREHDKDPKLFFDIMFQLKDVGVPFRLSVLGQVFKDVPGTGVL